MRQIATAKGAKAIMLFIAELNGFKKGTVKDKYDFGVRCWLHNTLHELDLTDEDDRSELHENIWLERLYAELDNYYNATPGHKITARVKNDISFMESTARTDYKWETPIELDASASMLQYIGILLNDERLCTMTNVIGDELSDPWEFEGIPRTQFKHAATPMLYGSSKACHELWQDKKHKYTIEQVHAFNQELATGALGLANAFKEFIINNVKPAEKMEVQIWDEKFTIECNRFKQIGEQTIRYDIYDSPSNTIKRISHTTTKSVPDLDQFRRYFVTLLIHNLDSQGGDRVSNKIMDLFKWLIDIHDAFIVNPEAAEDTRAEYCAFLTELYNNRETILNNYFQSIGIGAEAQSQWNKVKSMVKPITEFRANHMALK